MATDSWVHQGHAVGMKEASTDGEGWPQKQISVYITVAGCNLSSPCLILLIHQWPWLS